MQLVTVLSLCFLSAVAVSFGPDASSAYDSDDSMFAFRILGQAEYHPASSFRSFAAMADEPVGGGHFLAAVFVGGGETRKMGEVLQAGTSLRSWVERKISQHLGVVPSEAKFIMYFEFCSKVIVFAFEHPEI